MKANKILIGYEVEGYFPFSQREIRSILEDMGVRLWAVGVDGSLSHGYNWNGKWMRGIEFSTYPKPLYKALDEIKKIFAWMQKNGCATRSECGLHTNVGLPNGKEPDLIQVRRRAKIREAAALFGRSKNSWCDPGFINLNWANGDLEFDSQFHKKILGLAGIALGGKSASFDHAAKMFHRLDGKKFQQKLGKELSTLLKEYVENQIDDSWNCRASDVVRKSSRGKHYLEFRVPGGANYHRRFNDVKKVTLDFARAVAAA
jgi:hypothetical protein